MAGNSQPQTTPDTISLAQFGGMLPAWDDTLLPPNQAADCLNGYLFPGILAGWRQPKLLYTLQSGTSKFAYRLPTLTEAIATATIFLLSIPSDGDTITLGEETYTFRTAISEAYDVLIGVDVTAAVTNLFAAFTLDNGASTGAGTLYGVGTTANPAINQDSPTTNILATDTPRIQVFAESVGASQNSTPVAASAPARAEWRYAGVATTTFQGGENISFDPAITAASTWLEFADPDTDVIRSPVVNDSFDRYYFASPSLQPKYNTRDRIEAGLPAWFLGVPPPGCSPSVAVSGGGDTETLGYTVSAGGPVATPGANTIYLVKVTPTGAMTLDEVTALVGVTAAAPGNFLGLLYSDDNGTPETLLNVGVETSTSFTAAEEVVSTFLNPTGLLAGVSYWIGFATDVAVDWAMDESLGLAGTITLNTYANGPPAVLSGVAANASTIVVWGDCTSDAVQAARSYVYTYLTEYGEESAPSPATVNTGFSNATWTIGLFQPPPDQIGVTRNLTEIRLYRSITSLAGATTYFHIVDLPITTGEYVDNISDDEIATNFQLASQLWTPPPEDLLGFVSMPNGMIAGWRANEIWFCEPYRPHAWPASYVLTTEYPIVGLGVSGNSVIACTGGAPYVASGVSPGSMSTTKVGASEPCHSRGSILSTNDGVYYASPNGMILVTQYGAVTNTTELWITRERWQQLTPQKNLRSVFLVSSYFSLGCVRDGDASVAQRGFTIQLNANDAQSFSIWPQPGGHRMGFSRLGPPNSFNVDNVRIDPWSSVCLVFQNGAVYYYDFSDTAPTMQTYLWRSKKFQQKSKKNFGAMRIMFTIPDGTPALNATRLEAATDDAVWDSLPADRYGIIRVYADDVLVTTREIRVPDELLRIASGFKADIWEFEIEARVPITDVQIATSVKALAQL